MIDGIRRPACLTNGNNEKHIEMSEYIRHEAYAVDKIIIMC